MPPPPKSPIEIERRHRLAARRADQVQHARERDVVDVVTGRGRERTVLAPAGHPAVYQPGIARETRLRPEAEPLEHAGPEAFDQHVGALQQLEHDLDRRGVLQIQGDRAPVAQQRIGRRRLVLPRRGALDAHDLRAEVGEHHRAERRGPDRSDLDDFDSGKRAHEECYCHLLL